MIDSDGIPHLPKIGYALNKYFLETYWAYPKAVFSPSQLLYSMQINKKKINCKK